MNLDLVAIDPQRLDAEPFTTSDIIAERAMVGRASMNRLIRTHENDLAKLGKVGFEIRALPGSRTGQSAKIYRLNEMQATFLITLLKNTEPVVSFKLELTRQFYAMRRELMTRQMERKRLTPIRREMTDAIRDCLPESPHKQMWYRHFNDLVYRTATGKTAAQLRKERGATKHANATEFLTSEEMQNVQRITGWVSSLIEVGFDYQQIKAALKVKAISA